MITVKRLKRGEQFYLDEDAEGLFPASPRPTWVAISTGRGYSRKGYGYTAAQAKQDLLYRKQRHRIWTRKVQRGTMNAVYIPNTWRPAYQWPLRLATHGFPTL